MRIAPIQPGDIVEVDKKGRRFFALVLAVDPSGSLKIEPISRGISWYSANSREVIRHWKKSARRRRQKDPLQHEDQLDLGLDFDVDSSS